MNSVILPPAIKRGQTIPSYIAFLFFFKASEAFRRIKKSMKSMIVFLLLCFGLQSSISSAQQTAKSDLQLLSEEFRILSRVINAISLQASINRNEIEDGALMAEILQIDNDTLNRTVSVHIDNAVLSEIKRMSREKESVDFSKEKKSARNKFKQLSNAFLFFNKTDEILKTIKDSKNYSNEFLVLNFSNFENEVVGNNRCYDLDTVKFRNFTIQLMQDADSHNRDGNKTIGILSGFHQQLQIFRDCLKNVSTIQNAFDSQLEKCEKHNIFKNLTKYLQLISKHGQSLLLFPLNQYTNVEILKKAEALLNVTSYEKTEINAMTESAMDKILMSFGALKQHNASHLRATSIYTPGFRQANDMLRVFDDLKSPWFLENVARSETAEKLERTLQSYKHIAESLVTLQLSWSEFLKKTQAIVANESVSDGVRGIAMVKKFQYIYLDYLNILQLSQNKVAKCVNLDITDDWINLVKSFVEQQNPGEAVCSAIVKIKESVTIMNNYILETGNETTNLLSYIGNATDRIDDVLKGNASSTNAISLENLINEKLNETGVIFNMIEEVTVLLSAMNILKENVQIGRTNRTTVQTVNLVLETLNVIPILECLLKNVDAWKNYQIQQTTIGILDFPSAEVLNKTNEYLNDLAVFQQKLAATGNILKYKHMKQTISDNPVLALDPSITKTLGTSVKVLEDLDELRNHRQQILEFKAFEGFAYRCLRNAHLLQWENPGKRLQKMIKDADEVNSLARNVRDKTLMEMSQVFEAAARIEGILGSQQQLYGLVGSLEGGVNQSGAALNTTEHDAKAAGQFRSILNIDMEFSKYKAQLKGAQSAVVSLAHYFDSISSHSHNHSPSPSPSHSHSHSHSHSLVYPSSHSYSEVQSTTLPIEERIDLNKFMAVWMKVSVILLAILGPMAIGIIVYECYAERDRIYNAYRVHYGKPEDFVDRWTYSFLNGYYKVLVYAISKDYEETFLEVIKMGVYVNSYADCGNTLLHIATRIGNPEMVKYLIENGADRSLLNTKNKTAEQMIPLRYQELDKAKRMKYEKIHEIYETHRNTKYRMSVPPKYPDSSFRIFVDKRTEPTLRNKFFKQFSGIVSNDRKDTTTHVIVKTDENGILVTNRLDHLYWIFSGSIIMQEKWMYACLKDDERIEHHKSYKVKSVKFAGVIYNTLQLWCEAVGKCSIPYLYGVYVTILAKRFKYSSSLSYIIETEGGSILSSIPSKEYFNLGSHPYLHVHLGPIFLIHDGTTNLSAYKNDKMYTLFTIDEFLIFMLKREINRDKSADPIRVEK